MELHSVLDVLWYEAVDRALPMPNTGCSSETSLSPTTSTSSRHVPRPFLPSGANFLDSRHTPDMPHPLKEAAGSVRYCAAAFKITEEKPLTSSVHTRQLVRSWISSSNRHIFWLPTLHVSSGKSSQVAWLALRCGDEGEHSDL